MARKASQQLNDLNDGQDLPGIDPEVAQRLREGVSSIPIGDLISQSEINSLLSTYELVNTMHNIRHPLGRKKSVRMYDFASPDKFSKDHLRILNTVHASFVENLGGALSDMLRTPVSVNFINVEQITYKEYLVSIPSTTLIVQMAAHPFSNSIVFEVNPILVGTWVDCLCGGDAANSAKPSELTQIDLAIVEQVLARFAAVYADSWSSLVTFEPEIMRVVSSEHYEDSLLPSDAVLICTVEMNTGKSYGIATVCIPAADVEALLRPVAAPGMLLTANRKSDKSFTRSVEKALNPVSLPCRVVMGNTAVSLSDVMNLRVGDVIRTDTRIDEDLEVWVGDKHVFACRPGTVGANLGVVVSQVLEELTLDSLQEATSDEAHDDIMS